MRITKAVIAAAGKGTRFLPVSKALPKEMLPILDKPIIQYLVEELVLAGIKDIIIVTNSHGQLIKDYFAHKPALAEHLKKTGQKEKSEKIKKLPALAKFTFVRQKGPYGNGTPVLAAKSALGDEPFVYAFGDDLVLARESFTKNMIRSFQKSPGIYVGVQEVQRKEVVKYGIIEPFGKTNRIKSIVEKPELKKAPTSLAVFGRYILTPQIFHSLEKTKLGKGGELWIADAVQDLIKKGHPVYYKKVEKAKWYTTGDPVSYLKAVRAYALASPYFRRRTKEIFK